MSQTHIAPRATSIALRLVEHFTTGYYIAKRLLLTVSVRGGRFSFLLYRTSEMSLYKEYITVDVDGGDILYNCARKRFCNVVKEDKLS